MQNLLRNVVQAIAPFLLIFAVTKISEALRAASDLYPARAWRRLLSGAFLRLDPPPQFLTIASAL